MHKFALVAAVVAATLVSDVAAAQQTAGYDSSVQPSPSRVVRCSWADEDLVIRYAAQHGDQTVVAAAKPGCPAHRIVCLRPEELRWFGAVHYPKCPY
jgi:hypothetical protein